MAALADDIELQLLDPGSRALVRLFRHEGMDWNPPEPKYRNLRVDPPDGSKETYAVLYTADTLPSVAMECRVLREGYDGGFSWSKDLAEQYRVVRYAFSKPALFIPIDGRNRDVLGLSWHGGRLKDAYAPFQTVALDLHQRFGTVVHGLSWHSYHRHQLGRVYALWHEHKHTIGLRISSRKPYHKLINDKDWKAFLAENPDIEPIDAP